MLPTCVGLTAPSVHPVYIYLFPWAEEDFTETGCEYIRKGGRLAAWILWPEDTTPDVWARILRRIRREITHYLNELRKGGEASR